MIDRGESAPDFELPDQDGRSVKLSDLRGQPVVLYFYPKAAARTTKSLKERRAPRGL
jgi:peroxiredoxin